MKIIDLAPITIQDVATTLESKEKLALSKDAIKAIQHCRNYLDNKLTSTETLFYGINTGFGHFCNERIADEKVEELQANLVMSHACGLGDEVPTEVVKIILYLKIRNLSLGNSAISLETIETLLHLYNNDILPVIFQQGSLGASGDLAPLAHLSLVLIGMGNVRYKGKKIATKDLPKEVAFKPLKLKTKEGLALLNGTQFSLAYAVWAAIKAQKIAELADMTAALSVDGFNCRLSPFDHRLHHARPHAGQIQTAKNILKWLENSEIAQEEKTSVQDPYAFRCVPQVHGASKDTLHYAQGIFNIEINSVTDNPLLFPDDDMIISGGNFHAQPLALPLDFLAIALAELASISERRTFLLISGQRGLPGCLTPEGSGLHSGFMIPQYTAASIVSQNKQLCTPASVDSIVSSNGQEDHVSMAANAATKLYRVTNNVLSVLAIEFMAAAQALEFRKAKTSPALQKIVNNYRKVVPMLKKDRILHDDMAKTIDFLNTL